MATSKPGQRLAEVDALRGLAALAVVLYHYTTRFHELFGNGAEPVVAFPGGHYGVNLFFIISGFVIFMTLQRTTRPMDFVVSRFSRLFPAYWVSIALTFAVTHALGLPEKLVSLTTALANVFMLHGLFGVAHVDGVYWTLEVELLFYVGMFTLYRLNWLKHIHWALAALVTVMWVYFLAARFAGIELSWTLSRLLILPYIAWFSLGVAIYLALNPRDAVDRPRSLLLAGYALVTMAFVQSMFVGGLACALAGLVYLAASGRIPVLGQSVLVWLGAISYPLYLLHENIGWSIQLQLLALGLPSVVIVPTTLAFSLALATVVSRFVERPAMAWIRARHRSSLAK
ncbi:acyltransferase [Ideonella sp. A 288]|uniref:acyltransferase family protein n=1 Tax=Ideonella sp. A 288 TaxID=1962181 RepID=UPI000B4C1763|nr:acyltransferase [Ideonella sp. A 288]